MALPTVYLYGNDERFTHYLDFGMDKPFVCDGIGTGFLLIKREVLLRFTPEVCKEFGPPFAVGHAPDGTEEGEDLSFCRRAKKLGYEIWADPTIPLGHVGKKSYTREDYDQAMEFQAWSRKGNTYEEHNIEGWMSIGELNWLHKTAGEMDSIVEIGSWKGRSTHALLSGCKGKVIAVDTWKGTPGEAGQPFIDAESRDVFTEDFMKNVGEFPNLEPMRMTSLEAAALIPDKSVDMVFIDGAHNYESVRDDIEAWLPKARKLICGHDYQWHGVQEAVTERFGGAFDTAETIWVKRL
jgi:predicted O-methyltransferase YrrM